MTADSRIVTGHCGHCDRYAGLQLRNGVVHVFHISAGLASILFYRTAMPAPRINMRKLNTPCVLNSKASSRTSKSPPLWVSPKAWSPNTLAWPWPHVWIGPPSPPWTKPARSGVYCPPPGPATSTPPADFGRIYQELRRKGITLALLWEEYCAETADLFSADHTTTPHAGRHEAAQFFTLQLPHATTPQSF